MTTATGTDTTTDTSTAPLPIVTMPASQAALVRAMPAGGRGKCHSSKYPLGKLLYYTGVSVPELALHSGVSYKSIQNAVTSGKVRTLNTARKIADTLNVRVVDLLTVEEAARLNVTLPDDAWVFVAPVWPYDPNLGMANVRVVAD